MKLEAGKFYRDALGQRRECVYVNEEYAVVICAGDTFPNSVAQNGNAFTPWREPIDEWQVRNRNGKVIASGQKSGCMLIANAHICDTLHHMREVIE